MVSHIETTLYLADRDSITSSTPYGVKQLYNTFFGVDTVKDRHDTVYSLTPILYQKDLRKYLYALDTRTMCDFDIPTLYAEENNVAELAHQIKRLSITNIQTRVQELSDELIDIINKSAEPVIVMGAALILLGMALDYIHNTE